MSASAHAGDHYYIPHGTRWPIMGSIGLFLCLAGAAAMLNGSSAGGKFMVVGILVVILMMFLWFGEVIRETSAPHSGQTVALRFERS